MLRKKLSRSTTSIQRQDFGAGAEGTVSLGQTVRRASRRRIEGEWLYRLCALYQPRTLLELGTHVGLSGLYQAGGLADGYQFISLEGDHGLAKIARGHFDSWGYPIQIKEGDFDQLLDHEELQSYRPDYVLLDGNHRRQATMNYMERLLPRMKDGGIMVFDDIRWSSEMTQAWQDIVQHPEVTVSIDLFTLGICFIRRPQAKEHFRFRYPLWP